MSAQKHRNVASDLTLPTHIWKRVLPDVAASLWMEVEFTFLRTTKKEKGRKEKREEGRKEQKKEGPPGIWSERGKPGKRCWRKDNVFNN